MEDNRPILLIDCLNLFFRSYAAFPTMSAHGYQMGGTIGFLKTLRKLVNENSPKAIYLAWEGGGSVRRRTLFKEYKQNRKPEKLNRFYEDDIPESEENKVHQMKTLVSLLKCVPVCQIYVSDCEGDDVIAYLSKYKFPNEKKIIVSSDKDFYQLLNDDTRIFSPHMKNFVTAEDVSKKFNITPINFALAKSLCGDPSDNIPGIKGFGFKTITKRFPIISDVVPIALDELLQYAQSHKDESKQYERVINEFDTVRRNWQLVYLDAIGLASYQTQKIDYSVSTFQPKMDKMSFIKKLISEGITDFDVETFFYTFSRCMF